jgi:uncharacterized iron-regulated membrane protein
MTFRKTIFWLHLAAGLTAGTVIAIMCFTGAALSFENELVNWAERDARLVTPPSSNAPRLPLRVLLENVRDTEPDARPTAITVLSDSRAAVGFTFGRDRALYANPYTGDVRAPASTRVHDFLGTLETWHRWLALGDEHRAIGKAVNGACNLAFCVLAFTGLYLWCPRSWSWRGVKAGLFFDRKLSGKARDFNWHNVIGVWSAPILIVLTLTAIPMSYRWGTSLVYRIAGETPPAPSAPGALPPTVDVPAPPPGTHRLDYDALLAVAQRQAPDWEQLTLRLGGAGQRGGTPSAASRPGGETSRDRDASRPRESRSGGARPPAQAVSITIKQPRQWPRTATTTLLLNPYTGEILRREGYADLSIARQIRSWTRFLHTGQALGAAGQLVAGLACLGGCLLVYTGFALAWRRFLGRKPKPAGA